MRSVLALLFPVFMCSTVPALAQGELPAPENLVIVAARSIWQPTTTAPFDVTLRSGERVTLKLEDVDQRATGIVRQLLLSQDPPPVTPSLVIVLNVRALTPPDVQARVNVTLYSGLTVKFRADDIRDDARLTFLRTGLLAAIASERSHLKAMESSTPVEGDTISIIRNKCAKDWPDDFRMRAYCQTQQDEGVAALQRRTMSGSPAHTTIRAKCASDWPDDFRMRNYCEEQQLKALASIR